MSLHLLDPAPPEEVVVVQPERGPADLSEARDRDLVRRIRSGDEEAFRRLFRRYAPAALGETSLRALLTARFACGGTRVCVRHKSFSRMYS